MEACFEDPVLLTLELMIDSKEGSRLAACREIAIGVVVMLPDEVCMRAFWWMDVAPNEVSSMSLTPEKDNQSVYGIHCYSTCTTCMSNGKHCLYTIEYMLA